MADRQREVIWTFQARTMLDEAVGYIAEDSLTAAQQLLIDALDAGASLTKLSERGRTVPELEDPNTRHDGVASSITTMCDRKTCPRFSPAGLC